MPRKAPATVVPSDTLDVARRRFGEWLATPPAARRPKTQQAMARELGRDPSILTRWRKEPAVQRFVESLLVEQNRDALPAAWRAVQRQAEAGDVQAARLLFDAAQPPEILALSPEQKARMEAIGCDLLPDYDDQPSVYRILIRRLAHLEVLLEETEVAGSRLSRFVRLHDQFRETVAQVQKHTESVKQEINVRQRVETIKWTLSIMEPLIAGENPALWYRVVKAIEAGAQAVGGRGALPTG